MLEGFIKWSEKYSCGGMLYVALLWVVCAYFGVYFDRVQDGM